MSGIQRLLGVIFILLLGIGAYLKVEHIENADTFLAIGGIGFAIVIIPLLIKKFYGK